MPSHRAKAGLSVQEAGTDSTLKPKRTKQHFQVNIFNNSSNKHGFHHLRRASRSSTDVVAPCVPSRLDSSTDSSANASSLASAIPGQQVSSLIHNFLCLPEKASKRVQSGVKSIAMARHCPKVQRFSSGPSKGQL